MIRLFQAFRELAETYTLFTFNNKYSKIILGILIVIRVFGIFGMCTGSILS